MTNVFSLAYFRHSASGYESERAGEAQGRFFQNFIRSIVRAFHASWPGWELSIHIDDRMTADPTGALLRRYNHVGLLGLTYMGEAKTLCGSMLWRLESVFDHTQDIGWVVCRDVDSLPMHRDRLMVEDAMAGDHAIHGLNDSESHSIPLLGGMIAINVKKFRAAFPSVGSVDQLISLGDKLGIDYNKHGADQQFLNQVVWPRLYKDALIHTQANYSNYDCKVRMAYPQVTELDKVIRHVGAAYDCPKACEVAEKYLAPEMLARIKGCEE